MGIVTDTNILYGIVSGEYPYDRVKKLPLIVTAINIIELTSSPKIKTEEGYRLVMNVCRTVRKINPTYQLLLPYDFVARECFGKKLNNRIKLSTFYDICKNGLNENEKNYSVRLRKERVSEYKNGLEEQIKVVRKNSELKAKLKYPNSASETSASDFLKEIQKVTGINPWSADKTIVQKKGKAMELYIRARANYHQKLTFDKGYEPAGNDQLDLANLMYVREEDQYWTTDVKWLNIINDVNMGHKLYSLQ